MSKCVLVAMSGGVDSSVVACRLKDEGFDVVGVTLHLWSYPELGRRGRCCAPEDVHDAQRAADQIGIAHYTIDRRDAFWYEVVAPFIDSYVSGITPSPCVHCNRLIKLAALFSIAEVVGAQAVATGHYARVVRTSRGDLRIARGVDRRKDQSYFLYATPPEQLTKLIFPLGESTKTDVRAEAMSRGLIRAGKGESQDLCFVESSGVAGFVLQHASDRIHPGEFVGTTGHVLGHHSGVHQFTIGQRKGLGVSGHPGPLYVVGIDAQAARVVLGSGEDLLADAVLVDSPVLSEGTILPCAAEVQVRYRHEPQRAILQRHGSQMLVKFAQPVRAACAGQVLVAYEGDQVLAGGIISRTFSGVSGAIPGA